MPLRSGKEKRTTLPPKRSYNRRVPVNLEPVRIEPVSIESVRIEPEASTPNVSINVPLQLSHSTISESEEYSVTLDSYDRIIKKKPKNKNNKTQI